MITRSKYNLKVLVESIYRGGTLNGYTQNTSTALHKNLILILINSMNTPNKLFITGSFAFNVFLTNKVAKITYSLCYEYRSIYMTTSVLAVKLFIILQLFLSKKNRLSLLNINLYTPLIKLVLSSKLLPYKHISKEISRRTSQNFKVLLKTKNTLICILGLLGLCGKTLNLENSLFWYSLHLF